MPQFNKRNMNKRTLEILRLTGRTIACYQQISGFPDPADRIPTNPYSAGEALPDPDFKKYYIFAAFIQNVQEVPQAEGQVVAITGKLTVPRLYVHILNKTVYFDPFLNGSRFQKVGALVDDENLVVYQNIKSVVLNTEEH